jgi:hypothetical protein
MPLDHEIVVVALFAIGPSFCWAIRLSDYNTGDYQT